jgi:lysozyme
MLSAREYEAYLSLSYNVGVNAVCSGSIPYKLRTQDYKGACETILKYNKARNPKTFQLEEVKGLTNVRNKEYAYCIGKSDKL